MRRLRAAEIERRVGKMLELVGLSALQNRMPRELSGGQQQRAALARALAFHPSLLLLDEPFSALDRKLREQMQLEVRRLQKELDVATVFITHDQDEALIMSDRIAVLNEGLLEQVGSPQQIYDRPANQFVAEFVGESNLLDGWSVSEGSKLRVRLDRGPTIDVLRQSGEDSSGRRVRVLIRPERFYDVDVQSSKSGGSTFLEGTVVDRIYTGASQKCRVRTREGLDVLAVLRTDGASRQYSIGDIVKLGFDPDDMRLMHLEKST
jgi:ABC-type Fe3+/spermidine/putrescine transport system ATPase subunit